MESLKQFGQIGRQHYEKLLLTLALLGLGGAVWILYQSSQREEEKIRTSVRDYATRKTRSAEPIELTNYQGSLKAAATPLDLELTLPHNLLNPVTWQRKPDGSLIKIQTGSEVGPGQMAITNISPLYFRITLERIVSPGSYFFGVQNEAATNALLRGKASRYANLTDNKKNPVFTLVEAKGPPDNPELVLELVESQQHVSVSKDQPFQRVEGYTADMIYKVDGRNFKDRRVGDVLNFGGENYKIVAINPNEVVLSALLNDKKFTVPYSAGP